MINFDSTMVTIPLPIDELYWFGSIGECFWIISEQTDIIPVLAVMKTADSFDNVYFERVQL